MSKNEKKQNTQASSSSAKEKNKNDLLKKNQRPQNAEAENLYKGRILRIMQKDIEGGMKIYPGLTKIKGISWSLSNAVCKKMGLDKNRKIESLSESEIKKLEEFLKNPDIPKYLKNRQKDFETGKDEHLIGSTLELKKEFDIKILKKIKSYRGQRHAAGLPVRGQRTRAHFRKNRLKGAGIKK